MLIMIADNRVKDRAFIPVLKAIYPLVKPTDEPPKLDLPRGWESGSWLMGLLEDAGFGDRVEVKCIDSWNEAKTVDEMAENMCLTRGFILPGYSDEEVEKVKELLPAELKKSKAFVMGDDGVKLRMRAWTAFAWK